MQTSMKKEGLGIRLLLFIAGVFFISFGVALTIRSNLGTSPISSIAYVSYLLVPALSVGTYTIIVNVLLVLLQLIILKKKKNKFPPSVLLQVPFVVIFGLFIDLSLFLTTSLAVDNYLIQWLLIIVSCIVTAFGIFLELKADVGYLPGEGLTMVISDTYNKNFGMTKVAIDSTMVTLSLIAVLVFHGRLEGVREGTIASAVLVGFIVQFYQKNVHFVDKLLPAAKPKKTLPEPYMTTNHFVITISRQYGSGGHAVGERIAKKLGVAFYDSKLIDLTAIASGFTPEYVEQHEQKLPNTLLYNLYKQNYAYVNEVIPPNDLLFMIQTKVIRNIAANESCVIVGRSADYILKGHKNCFNVFVHADKTFRKGRVIHDYFVRPEEAERVMEKKDRERMNYSKYYTGREWADSSAYDLTIETPRFGIEATADMIIDAAKKSGILPEEVSSPGQARD